MSTKTVVRARKKELFPEGVSELSISSDILFVSRGSVREIEKFKHDWREINDMMKTRQASVKELEHTREVERKLEKSLDKQLEKAKPTKQKDVVRLTQKEEPQERDRDEDLSRESVFILLYNTVK